MLSKVKPYLWIGKLVLLAFCFVAVYRFACDRTADKYERQKAEISAQHAIDMAAQEKRNRDREKKHVEDMAKADQRYTKLADAKRIADSKFAAFVDSLRQPITVSGSGIGMPEAGTSTSLGDGAGRRILVFESDWLSLGKDVYDLGQRGAACAVKLTTCQMIVEAERK